MQTKETKLDKICRKIIPQSATRGNRLSIATNTNCLISAVKYLLFSPITDESTSECMNINTHSFVFTVPAQNI